MKKLIIALTVLLLFCLSCFDAGATLESVWDYAPVGLVTKIYAADLDNDGKPEILSGTTDGNFNVLTYNGKAKWAYSVTKRETRSAKINDFHVRGDMIAIGSDRVYYMNSIGIRKWKFETESEVNAIFIKDLDEDRHNEIIAGSKNNGIYVLDDLGNLKWKYPLDEPIQSIYAVDIDNDNSIEIIAGSSIYDDDKRECYGNVYVTDNTGKLKWSYEVPANDLVVSDLDNDGLFEIVVGSENHGIYVLDSDGNLMWKFETEKMVTRVYAEDLDGDGSGEIIASSFPFIYVLDKDATEIWKHEINSSAYDIFVTDLENDGTKDILVGSYTSAYIIDSMGHRRDEWKMPTRHAEIVGVYAADLYGGDVKNVILGYNWAISYMDMSRKKSKIDVFEVKIPAGATPPVETPPAAETPPDKDTNASYEELPGKSEKDLMYQQAEEYYKNAMDYYENGDYESASKYAQMAERIYNSFDDEAMIQKVSGLIYLPSDSDQTTTKPATEADSEASDGGISLYVIGFIALGFLLLIIIILVVFIFRQREKGKESEKPESKVDRQ